ncbi:Phosphate import ATP-binding protein PstB [Tritonibacter multivorans]|uniref:Phosphate import ATP-binding protein PstB n=1 Tax=Tritonibacter multivorans TaxID=928856 RepID=A0A0P1GBU8_9RHOB|nr:ATP-binding cassette domain-containing protein [Tritonibacter multivorans]MDA7421352.1 ATP-binding cassette domain-containing protein [Tritonibacter multivorans]CUH78951.1 Phosphate import ATP-binding protein PstB [Tritonibacter multivorans]SFD27158.1 phosphate transport system ATP-binding protein [Tritonibacter multivorans]
MLHDLNLSASKHQATSQTAEGTPSAVPTMMSVRNLSLRSQGKAVVDTISFDLHRDEVLAFIGRSGSGKSALLRSLVRMEKLGRNPQRSGEILFGGQDLMRPDADLPLVRRQVALIAQETNPFPMSIWDNIAYGLKLHRLVSTKGLMAERIEQALRRARLWDAVKDQLHKTQGTSLPGPQRRQLCIARALALDPQIMLFDRPSSAGDRMSFTLTQEIVTELRKTTSIVLVAHSLENAAHLADRVAFVDQGRIVELDTAEMIFTNAMEPETRAFLEQSTYM